VRTLIPCVFLTLQRDLFLHLLDRAPQVRSKLEAQVSKFLSEPNPMQGRDDNGRGSAQPGVA
jgi:hypothetical protein